MQIDAEDLLNALCFVWYFSPFTHAVACVQHLYMRCTVWPGEVCVFEWNGSKEFGKWSIGALMSMFVRSHQETTLAQDFKKTY